MKRTLALILSLVMCLGLLAGCGDKKTDDGQTDGKTLVVGTQNFDGKFSPFFYTNDYENQVMGMVFDGLFLVDREGSVVLKGIEGDVRPYNGTDYTYKGIADCDIVENSDGTVDYNITLKEGVKFSDGEEMTIDDVIFSYYVLLDPAYDGVSTLYSLPIKGLEAYRSGMDTVQNLILAAGPDAYAANDFYTEEQYNAYWTAFNAAGVKFAQEILDYVVAAGSATADDSVAAQAGNWGFDLADDATVKDFWAAIVAKYGYDISDDGINAETAGTSISSFLEAELGDARLDDLIGAANHEKLAEDIELLDGAAEEFDLDKVLRGELSPVFFGSALTNFGVEPFLENFLRLTSAPLARVDSLTGEPVDPCRDEFSAFIFKIQANMNKAHRDRIAFMRICSGKFERGMEAYHVQEGKNIKLATGTSLMADDRAIVSEAYAGDIIGLFDPGIFSIGDTLCTGKKHVQFAGIPTFAPEHFARVTQVDTMKRKQFVKGMEQIAQEGAIQIFRDLGAGMEEVIVGVVGVLQLEVLEYRLKNEYNVDIRMQTLPYEHLRWVLNDPEELDIKHLDVTSDTRAIEDMKGNPLLLFGSPWSINWAEQHNEALKLSEFGNLTF